MRRRLLIWLAVFAGAGAVQAPPALRFLPASTDSAGVWFDHPDSLDWDPIARRALPDLDFSRPDTVLLAAGWFEPAGSSAVRFRAPLPSSIPLVHYLGLAPEGMIPISPTELGGEVLFETRPPRWEVTRYGAHGRILGRQTWNPQRRLGVVFVVWSDRPIRLQHHPATASVASNVAQVVQSGGERWSLPLKDTYLDLRGLRNLSAALFREGGTGRAFIMVGGDSDVCTGSFVLYEVTAVPRLLAQRGGECDP